jgi:tRNA(adenine34) deaminase
MAEVDDLVFMKQALALANKAAEMGEVPVGALVVENGKVIAEGVNSPIASNDPTAHAEIQAIRAACLAKQNYRLPGTTLYVTLEPCAMCAGTIIHSRIDRVVVAAEEPRAGAAGSALNVLNNSKVNHQCQLEFGLMREESSAILKRFFKSRR